MAKITGKVVDIQPVDDTFCKMLLDLDQIWGFDEVAELKVSKRIVAELFAGNETQTDDVEELLLSGERRTRVSGLRVKFALKKE